MLLYVLCGNRFESDNHTIPRLCHTFVSSPVLDVIIYLFCVYIAISSKSFNCSSQYK